MLNEHKIIGRLGNDVELKYLPNGTAAATLSVATTESWNDKASGQKQERTEWNRVVLFGKAAEIVNQHARKGTLMYFSGPSKTRSWDDKDGNKKYATELNAKEFKFLGSNSTQETSDNNSGGLGSSPVSDDSAFASSDIPF